ncbi:ArnT family glycosyltransferase [Elusimicrobiota bacterium]
MWIKKDFSAPVTLDEARHMERLKNYYYFPIESTLNRSHDPVYYILAASVARLSGRKLLNIRMINIFWFIILLISVYSLGSYLFDKNTGLLGSVILALYPVVYGSSRLFREEFAVMAMAPLCILFLFKSRKFEDRKYSVLFGLVCGVTIMTRYLVLIYIIGPLIFFLIRAGIGGKNKKRIRKKNIILSIIAASAVIGIRYFNFERVRYILQGPFIDEVQSTYAMSLLEGIRVHIAGLANYQMSLFFLVLFMITCCFFLKRSKPEIKWPLVLWIIVPLMFFTLIPHRKIARLIIPYLPAFALISASGVISIKNNIKKHTIILVIVIVGLVQYYMFSFGIGMHLNKFELDHMFGKIFYINNDYDDLNAACYKPAGKIFYNNIYSYLSQTIAGRLLLILPVSQDVMFNNTWSLLFWLNDTPFTYVILENYDNFIPELKENIKKAEFILVGEADYNKGFSNYLDEQMEIKKSAIAVSQKKEEIDEFINFLENEYKIFKKEILEDLNNFKVINKMKAKGGNIVYLMQK